VIAPDLVSAFAGARVLLTGGLGFIGSNLAIRLVGLGSEVLLVDNLIPTHGGNFFNIAPIRDHVRIETIDVRDTGRLKPLIEGCDYIFNLAGQTSHLDSMRDPVTDLEINCSAQLRLLESCRAVNSRCVLVFASTRQIYGRPSYLPVDEKHLLHPVDINGINKMAGEAYHILYQEVYDIPTIALRLTNTYGPRMRIKDERQTFVGVWLRRVLEKQPFEVWDGTQMRDFIYVDDAVEAFLLAAAKPEARGHVFNIGGGQPVSLNELAELVIAANGGGDFVIKSFPTERKRIDIGDYYADDRLFRRTTGWQPGISLIEGLRQTLAFFRENLSRYV